MRLIIIYSRYFTKRLLLIMYVAIFVYLFIVLRERYFDVYTHLIPNPFYDFFSQFSTFIYSVIIFTIFGFATTLVEIVLAFTNSTAKIAIEKRKIAIHKHINETLFDHIVNKKSVDDDKIYIRKIKRKFRTDYPRLLFINRLRRIMILTTGEVHEHCIQMFHLLKANWLLRAYLISPYPRHELFALKIIGEFKLTRFTRRVKRLMKKRNAPIASEAMYAYIKLDPQTDFTFLTKRKRPISKLDFYNFVQIAADYKNIDYSALVSSSIPMVSALGIRLANNHKVASLKIAILKRLEHDDENIRYEAQNAFLSLLEAEDVKLIFDKFDIFTSKNKIKILEMLSDYSTNPLVVTFYHNVIESYNFELKAAAMNILLSKNTVELIKYRNHDDDVINKVYKQLMDFNL